MTWIGVLGCFLAILSCIFAQVAKNMEICTKDYEESNVVLNLIHVHEDIKEFPRLLCFVNTISTNHETKAKAKAIKNTWGKRCDKLIFLSNASDPELGAIALHGIPSDHNHLWQKHKASMIYIWDHYRHEYDWFYKADDDAYVIVNNLKAYLRSPEIVMQEDRIPLQLGHRFRLTEDLINYYVGDKDLLNEYKKRWSNWWVFNSGGPGVAMNPLYMQRAIESFSKTTCLSDKYSEQLPDDASIAFCMAWNDVFPPNTRDLQGRERWHANHPHGVYATDPALYSPDTWFIQYHEGIGGIQHGKNCCASDSIAFHYISPDYMYHIERQLYDCRQQRNDDKQPSQSFLMGYERVVIDTQKFHSFKMSIA